MGKFLLGFVLGMILGAVGILYLPISIDAPQQFGRFTGDVTATFLEDGRRMRLEKDFAYVDADGKVWLAPANSVIDGASSPQPFWSVIGGPFEGKFRNASVVHDVACVEKKEPSEAVHRMFYFACRCGGVNESKAKAMYYAVSHFGPQWRIMEDGRPSIIAMHVELSDEDVNKVVRYFEKNNPAVEEIPELEVFAEQ